MDKIKMTITEFGAGISTLFAMISGVGIYRLLKVKKENKKLVAEAKVLHAEAEKTDAQTTDQIAQTALALLSNAQLTASVAVEQADRARLLAMAAQEEVAFLRRWIIDQGLVPPKYQSALEEEMVKDHEQLIRDRGHEEL